MPNANTSSPRTTWQRRLLDMSDEIYSGRAGLPPGASRAVFSTLDYLRAERGDTEDMQHVERLAVMLHQFQALIGTAGLGSLAVTAARRNVRRSTLAWMQNTRLADVA